MKIFFYDNEKKRTKTRKKKLKIGDDEKTIRRFLAFLLWAQHGSRHRADIFGNTDQTL